MLLQHIMHKLFCKINIRCALHINTIESLDIIQLGCMQSRVSFESCLRQGPIYIPPPMLRYQVSMSTSFDRYLFVRLHPFLHFSFRLHSLDFVIHFHLFRLHYSFILGYIHCIHSFYSLHFVFVRCFQFHFQSALDHTFILKTSHLGAYIS